MFYQNHRIHRFPLRAVRTTCCTLRNFIRNTSMPHATNMHSYVAQFLNWIYNRLNLHIVSDCHGSSRVAAL